MSLLHDPVRREAFAQLSHFRGQLHASMSARSDELFELTDALLCTDGPVKTLVGLSLAPEHRRGHGALYDAVNHGRIHAGRLRDALAHLPLPRAENGRLVLAVDVSPWLRPDAVTSPDRAFCHTYGRGEGKHQMVPGWPYSVVAALEPGRTSWTVVLDAVRLGPGEDVAEATTAQVRAVVERLVAAGQWKAGDLDVLIVLDAGYDVPRIAFLLRDLPVEVLGRMRPDRVMRRPTPAYTHPPQGGRPPKHGGEFVFGQPDTEAARPAVGGPVDVDCDRRPRPAVPRPAAGRRPPAAVGTGRRGFRNLRPAVIRPAGAPKPSRAGPGRLKGSKNVALAPRYDVGRVLKTGEAFKKAARHKVGTKPRRTG